MSAIAYDIETLPLASSLAEPYPEEDRDPPASYKHDDAIARWREKDQASWAEARVKECSLNPRLGRVAAIGYAGRLKDSEDVVGWARVAETEDDERVLLEDFWLLANANRLVSFNGLGFDVPFLITRSMLLGLTPQAIAPKLLRRYDFSQHFDVRMALTNWDSRAPGKMGDWLSAFGLEPKTGNGGDVYGMAQENRWGEIAEYTATDALRTWELAVKVAPWHGVEL